MVRATTIQKTTTARPIRVGSRSRRRRRRSAGGAQEATAEGLEAAVAEPEAGVSAIARALAVPELGLGKDVRNVGDQGRDQKAGATDDGHAHDARVVQRAYRIDG